MSEYVKQLVYQLCKQKEQVDVLELHAQPDHAHLLVSILPKYSISEFMGYLKARWHCDCFNNMKVLGGGIGDVTCGQEGTA